MLLSNKQITEALIRLCSVVCAFVARKPLKTGFLCRGPNAECYSIGINSFGDTFTFRIFTELRLTFYK